MAADEETPFDRYRQRIDRPLVRLFREYGLDRKRWLVVGLLANLVAQAASLLPPVVLGSAIDAVFGESDAAYRSRWCRRRGSPRPRSSSSGSPRYSSPAPS